eukprot:TRINITY_DN2272_c0_g1_i1.p4 TRINITY_DN2272_c0_g1~~TRINITY_DN2272_c0_g1_i1.p4  ORF type:complete len:103 (-),score=1.81 TRINITY_DN2272_c0_g1_i1:182-490(-)
MEKDPQIVEMQIINSLMIILKDPTRQHRNWFRNSISHDSYQDMQMHSSLHLYLNSQEQELSSLDQRLERISYSDKSKWFNDRSLRVKHPKKLFSALEDYQFQ